MARQEDVIWAAGFVDGEGCIAISRQEKHQSVYHWLLVTVFQNVREPLVVLQDLFGGSIRPASHGKGPAWIWRACGPTAGAALEEMLPFMRVKDRQAEIAVRFQGRRLATGKPRPADFSGEQDETDFRQVRDLKRVI